MFTCTYPSNPHSQGLFFSHRHALEMKLQPRSQSELIAGPGSGHKVFGWSPRWLAEVLQHFLFTLSKPLELGTPHLEQLRPPSANVRHGKLWSPHTPQCRHCAVMLRPQSGPRKNKQKKKNYTGRRLLISYSCQADTKVGLFYQLKELYRSYVTIWNSFYT